MKNNIPIEILNDPKLKPLVKKYGLPDLTKYHGRIGIFQSLVRSIIYQQLSGKAAGTIYNRFLSLFLRKHPTPDAVLDLLDEQMRSVGLSKQKISYLKDLAKHFRESTIPHHSFHTMPSMEILAHLTKVKGIGEWTVHMFLIFTLHRPDVLPVGDLAIQKGFKKVYNLKNHPDRNKMELIARPWRAYASLVSWYLWRVMDEGES
jgi:DNA-3-methyladenine glycosylase II